MSIMFVEPFIQIKIVILLGPQHAGKCLPVNAALIFAQSIGRDPLVKLISLGYTFGNNLVEFLKAIYGRLRAEPQAHDFRSSCRHVPDIMSCSFSSRLRRIDSVTRSGDYVVVECVFHKRSLIRLSPKAIAIGFVVREE